MQKITVDDPESRSADIVAENLDQLKALFPEVFIEEKVDFQVLKQLLGSAVDEREEKYGLNWHGKRQARQLALTPSTGTLRPSPEESVDWDTTQNLMIEGDNLEVLKLLTEELRRQGEAHLHRPAVQHRKGFLSILITLRDIHIRKLLGTDRTDRSAKTRNYHPIRRLLDVFTLPG